MREASAAALALRAMLSLCVVFGLGCGSRARSPEREFELASLRSSVEGSSDPEELERWLLAELISKDGSAAKARQARAALGRAGGKDMLAQLGMGLDDALHGELDTASEHYLEALKAARDSSDPRAPFVAWFTASQAVQYRRSAPDLWKRWGSFVNQTLREPRNIGWRAREELVGLWRLEAHANAEKDVENRASDQYGCARNVSLAGPFGRNSPLDLAQSFLPERTGPWPEHWPADPWVGEEPHVLKVTRSGCSVSVDEPVGPGLFYLESYLDLPERGEVLFAVRGALRLWVDDHLVLERDPRVFGSWLKLGARVRLEPGRHRVLARVTEPRTSLRILYPDGRPLRAQTSTDGTAPYSLIPPQILPFTNIWDPYLKDGRLLGPNDPLLSFLGAELAGLEGQADVAALLLEPLLKEPKRASGPVLSTAALFTTSDPVFPLGQRRDLVRELEEQAALKDPRLWRSRLSLALWEGEKSGLPEGARKLEALVDQFPKVPDILHELSGMYKELDWSSQFTDAARKLARRFPRDPRGLALAVLVLDAEGDFAAADRLAADVARLDPDSELQLNRALNRQDYTGALAELKRIGSRRPERKDIAERIFDVLLRAGDPRQAWKKLEAALRQDRRNERIHLDLADARLAEGQKTALTRALVDAVENGAATTQIEQALDLVEGQSDLEPYRLKAEPLILAYEQSGVGLTGTATRVLDYAAIWVHADGSSRMLEHEIVHIQSAEAVTSMAEQPLRNGLFLHLRVIKRDGRWFEPELVEGKPTVTMPHLEVGDYLEIERLESNRGESRRGLRYVGPRWFFREEKIPYVRSEIVVISPKDKPLLIEAQNQVPSPEESIQGPVKVRRWRVERSLAAPQEPFSAPITETLPSLQFGWGVSLSNSLRQLSDSVADLTPVDPRIRRIAQRIVAPLPESAKIERARRLYRWAVENLQNGEENDGRRIILGKNGNLWRGYQMLCGALGLDVDYVVAENRLTLPPQGPFSAAALYTQPIFRVRGEKGDQWLTFGGRYVPFGYVPAELRGMPAYVLGRDPPEPTRVPKEGSRDTVRYGGTVRVAPDGSADLDLEQSFEGRYAMGFRSALSEIPEGQLRGMLESRLLGSELRGIQLESYRVDQLEELDRPLVLRFKAKMPGFAQRNGDVLSVFPPFSPRLTQLAALPSRQTTLLMVEAIDRQVELVIELPAGSRAQESIPPAAFADGERRVETRDSLDRGKLHLRRSVTLPAGRVAPNEYPAFAQFARRAEEALLRTVRVQVK